MNPEALCSGFAIVAWLPEDLLVRDRHAAGTTGIARI